MRAAISLLVPVAFLMASGSAAAGCQEYWLPNEVVQFCLESGNLDPPPPFCVGGRVVIGPPPVSITIIDNVLSPVGATVCQDLDQDGACDEFGPSASFCGSIEVSGFGWDSSAPLIVQVDGPLSGNPVTSACGLTVSMGTHGWVCAS